MQSIPQLNVGSKGYYSLSVVDSENRPVPGKQLQDIGNVVTYAGAYYSLFGSLYNYTGTYRGRAGMFWPLKCNVGTGTTELTRDSAGLGSALPATSNSVVAHRSGNEVDNLDGTSTVTLTRVFTFTLGAIVGTISEVGLTMDGMGGFVAGQLIKDEFGDPTTVTLLSDEQLIITYTLEFTVPNVSTLIGTGTVTAADSTEYTYNIYLQPYFRDETVGSSNYFTRYMAWIDRYGTPDDIHFYSSTGGNATFNRSIGLGAYDDPAWVISHDGTGGRTFTTRNPLLFAPSSFNSSTISYIALFSASTSNNENLDITSNIVKNSMSNLVIEWTPALRKTADESLQFNVEFKVQT